MIASPTMTDPPIHDLEMTDIEYAALASIGYEPHLEQLMMEVDVPPDEARNLTRLVGGANQGQTTRDRGGMR